MATRSTRPTEPDPNAKTRRDSESAREQATAEKQVQDAQSLFDIAGEAMRHDGWTTLLHAVYAGWIVALLVWVLPGAEHNKVAVIVVLTWLIAVGGFAHVIAGSSEVLHGVPWRGELGRCTGWIRAPIFDWKHGRRDHARCSVESRAGDVGPLIARPFEIDQPSSGGCSGAFHLWRP